MFDDISKGTNIIDYLFQIYVIENFNSAKFNFSIGQEQIEKILFWNLNETNAIKIRNWHNPSTLMAFFSAEVYVLNAKLTYGWLNISKYHIWSARKPNTHHFDLETPINTLEKCIQVNSTKLRNLKPIFT